jgi:hypothetical protein
MKWLKGIETYFLTGSEQLALISGPAQLLIKHPAFINSFSLILLEIWQFLKI